MAYTVVYSQKSKYDFQNKHYFDYEDTKPYEKYMRNVDVGKVIFSRNDHHGPYVCIHQHCIIDYKDSNTATFVYTYNGDYKDFDIVITVLIDKDRKMLVLHDGLIDFDYSGFSKNIQFNGGKQSLMKFYKENEYTLFEDMKELFFGSEWKFHHGSTKFIHKKKLEYKNKLDICDFPEDIKEEIWKKLDIHEWINVKKLIHADIGILKSYIDNYIGVETNHGFRSYKWDKVIAVYNCH